MLTQNQLKERLKYVCGSDCATILGLNPYSNVVKLWQEKTGHRAQEEISNKYVKSGNFLESAVRAWFEAETGLKVTLEPNLIVHPIHKWMAGNIDGRINKDEILEIKTTSCEKGWGKQGENKIPDNYLCQITHYMAVTCAKVCHVAVLIRGIDFRTYRFERNIELEDIVIAKEQAFFEMVQKNECPEPASSAEIISFHGYHSDASSIVADAKTQEYLDKLVDINKSIKELEQKKFACQELLKLFMCKNDTLLDQSGKIAGTWKSCAQSQRFDSASFKEANEKEYLKYLKTCSPSRRFIIKTTEGL